MRPHLFARTISTPLAVCAAIAACLATPAATADVRYGHHHLNVTSIAEHMRFWVDGLGGTAITIGDLEGVRFPGVVVLLRQQRPSGGTKGSTVNHVGFQVRSIRETVAKLKAAGYPIVTRAEVTSVVATEDVVYIPNQDAWVAFVMGPDETKVEFFENTAMTMPIALHHIHFAARDVPAMKSWYVRTFGAEPGVRGAFESASLPGVDFRWGAAQADVAPTSGRTLDHIGLEVKGLRGFCAELTRLGVVFDRPYDRMAGTAVFSATIVDPWGTTIELTEGLDRAAQPR